MVNIVGYDEALTVRKNPAWIPKRLIPFKAGQALAHLLPHRRGFLLRCRFRNPPRDIRGRFPGYPAPLDKISVHARFLAIPLSFVSSVHPCRRRRYWLG